MEDVSWMMQRSGSNLFKFQIGQKLNESFEDNVLIKLQKLILIMEFCH